MVFVLADEKIHSIKTFTVMTNTVKKKILILWFMTLNCCRSFSFKNKIQNCEIMDLYELAAAFVVFKFYASKDKLYSFLNFWL